MMGFRQPLPYWLVIGLARAFFQNLRMVEHPYRSSILLMLGPAGAYTNTPADARADESADAHGRVW